MPRLRIFGNNSISHSFFKVFQLKFGGQSQFYVWTKIIYCDPRNQFYSARARAFSLAENRFIQGNINNDVISSDIFMKYFSKVKYNFRKLNYKVFSRLVRVFVHTRARIDKITPFSGKTLISGFFDISFTLKLCLKVW